jgi:hypothetical protein
MLEANNEQGLTPRAGALPDYCLSPVAYGQQIHVICTARRLLLVLVVSQ